METNLSNLFDVPCSQAIWGLWKSTLHALRYQWWICWRRCWRWSQSSAVCLITSYTWHIQSSQWLCWFFRQLYCLIFWKLCCFTTWSASFVMRELQVKAVWHHHASVRMAKNKQITRQTQQISMRLWSNSDVIADVSAKCINHLGRLWALLFFTKLFI